MSTDHNPIHQNNHNDNHNDQAPPLKSQTPASCDRRLSRAARQILLHHTLPILQHHHPSHNLHHKPLSTTITTTLTSSSSSSSNSEYSPPTKKQIREYQTTTALYSTLLAELMTSPSTCVLNPNRDVYWDDEIRYDTRLSSYKSRRGGGSRSSSSTNNNNNNNQYRTKQQLHKCWICQKEFVSRFYLDRHLDDHRRRSSSSNHHHPTTAQTNDNDKGTLPPSSSSSLLPDICPAQELCYHLNGGGNLNSCRYQALHDEPYYGRGHPENPMIKRSHRRSVVVGSSSSSSSLLTSLEPIQEQSFTSVEDGTTIVADNSDSSSSNSSSRPINENHSVSSSSTSSRPEPCNETETTIRRNACHETFGHLCFEGNDDLIRDITGVLCDEIWSCDGIALHWHERKRGGRGRSVGTVGGSSSSTVLMVGRGRHHWREEWRRYHDGVRASPVWIVVVVMGFLVYYGMVYGWDVIWSVLWSGGGGGGDGRRRRRKDKRS